ncbi:hypothetical protein RJT34_03260 [Clitoria ternatea]|uniref:Uncharacterized protein n=1 Tax=Clitoria ternatea TaxID=43366 RepID=A0AAN9Q1L1_CLITE
MSDIAMLVAEEYERRIKSLKKGEAVGEIDLISGVSVLVSRLKQKKQLVQWAVEPKTQIALAASNSFFSA